MTDDLVNSLGDLKMKKAPFFLYERDTGLVSKEYKLSDFFTKGLLNKYEIRNIGKNFSVTYFSDYENRDSYKEEYKYIIIDDYSNPVSQDEIYLALESLSNEINDIDVLFYVPDVKRGIPVCDTGINNKKRYNKRFRLKPIFCLNEIKQTCKQYHDEFEPLVKRTRVFHNTPCWEDENHFCNVINKNWKKYRKYQYK